MDGKIILILLCVALFALNYLLISYLITLGLAKLAMNRKQPRNIDKQREKIVGSSGIPGIVDKLNAATRVLEEKPHKEVVITGYDGKSLVGHFFEVENSKRIILAMHGWRSTWAADFGIVADFWAESGCSVLYAEQRAQGNSEGDYIAFGMLERYDVQKWADWLDTNTDSKLPIYLCGISLGAATVLMASDLDMPSRVKGIVADCGFTSAHDIWRHVVKDNLHIPYHKLREWTADRICKRNIGITTKACSTIDSVKKTKLPIFFIHGTADKFVPFVMTERNYAACSSPKKLLIVDGAAHGMSYILEQEKYESLCHEFWQENDNAI